MAKKKGLLPSMTKPYLEWLKTKNPTLYKMVVNREESIKKLYKRK